MKRLQNLKCASKKMGSHTPVIAISASDKSLLGLWAVQPAGRMIVQTNCKEQVVDWQVHLIIVDGISIQQL